MEKRDAKVFFLPDVCLEPVDLRLFEWVVVDVPELSNTPIFPL